MELDNHVSRNTAVLLAMLFMAAGCSSGNSEPSSGASSSTPSPIKSSSPTSPSAASTTTDTELGQPSKLLVVVLENHSARNAASGMPGLAAAAERYGRATHSFGLTHPSLPNYLAIAGGSTFGVRDDNAPAAHPLPGSSVFRQVLAAGKVAKTYAEGMTTNCQVSSRGRYAVKHNPWAYFRSPAERHACLRNDVPAGTPTNGALHHDIAAGTLPTFGLLIPDLCNDAHDCPLSTADRWLHSWLGPLVASRDFRTGRLAIVVTFDEDHGDAKNNILTAVLHQRLHGSKVAERLDHNALSHAVSRLVGEPPLRNAAAAPDLLAAFGLAASG
jgi:phosphatidylinositol-3-phosphatase